MRLNKDKPNVIGASAQVDHKTTDDLSQKTFAGVEGKRGMKARTKPTTSITRGLQVQQDEIKQNQDAYVSR